MCYVSIDRASLLARRPKAAGGRTHAAVAVIPRSPRFFPCPVCARPANRKPPARPTKLSVCLRAEEKKPLPYNKNNRVCLETSSSVPFPPLQPTGSLVPRQFSAPSFVHACGLPASAGSPAASSIISRARQPSGSTSSAQRARRPRRPRLVPHNADPRPPSRPRHPTPRRRRRARRRVPSC